MEMTGEQRIEAPRDRVWAALNDPEVLKACIPGCQSLEQIGPDRMRAVAAVKVGPIGARFKGEVTLSDLDPPNGYRIDGEGQGGVAGFAKGGATVRLRDDGNATILDYAVNAQIGGKLAQVGGALIDATARQMAGSFFRKLGEKVATYDPDAAAAPVATAAATAVEPAAVAAPSEPSPPPGVAPAAATSTAVPAPAHTGRPLGWALAVIGALLIGYLVGRGGDIGGAGAWAALAIGLVVVVVAGAGFLLGRGAGGTASVVVIDQALLERLAAERRS